jgi:CubicO group peptidase (beta-lactamase class C family)
MASGCGSPTATKPSPKPPPLAAAKHEGFSVAKLRAAERRLSETRQLLSVLVQRHGHLVLERYYHGASRDRPWSVFSVTKSVVSALIGMAIRDGRLEGVDQKLVDVFPDKLLDDADPRIRTITLRDLLTMTAGYRNENTPFETDDWVRALLNRPLASDPGAIFSYDDGSAHLLSAVLTKATGVPAATFARRTLFGPLGIDPGRWNTDGQGRSLGSGGLFLRPRDMLRIGQLYLQKGRWGERQIVPSAWVRESTRKQISIPGGYAYGYLWWIDTGPHGGYLALGYRGQTIAVFPRLALVVTTTGTDEAVRTKVLDAVLHSVDGRRGAR